MYKVGITGGIGSGKSTVCELLAEFGVALYDSDSRAKELMNSNEELKSQLIGCFGQECYTCGVLNRSWLASRVFNSREQMERLNSIVHPAVMRDFVRWADEQTGDYVVLESAILFEAGLECYVDATVAVMAPEELRLERAMQRDGATREEILSRMRNQMNDNERIERSTYAILNISLEELSDEVIELHRRLCYDSKSRNH